MSAVEDKWNEIIETLKEEFEIKDLPYTTWIKPLKVKTVNETDLVLSFDSDKSQGQDAEFLSRFIMNKYGMQLAAAVSDITGINYSIKIDVSEPDSEKTEETVSNTLKNSSDYSKTGLNEKFTFDTFVVGNNNKFAQRASLAVAESAVDESPEGTYNPLFIYGGPGLGKTHLMHAIGNYIIKENPAAKVLYVTSEIFTNEVINAIRNNKSNTDSMQRFREKYRLVDILLIDDIQFIIGKEGTQEEFFHTFNTLQQAGKQIVITSDRSPKEMETLEERIRTRFEMGLMADIGYPEYELRMAILRKKVEDDNFEIPDDVLNYIATNIKTNVRELEGALNKLNAYSKLEKINITMDIAARELQSIISPDKPREITPQTIIEVVADHFNITIDQMVSTNRSNFIAKPRQIAMFLCKTMTDCSLEAIGNFLGGRNHSTVIHGARAIADEYEKDPELKEQINAIKKKIYPV